MRESSTEKDLKRLLGNVSIQLEAIKRGYLSFKDSQLELVKQYPEMVKDELLKYEEAVLKFFSLLPEGKLQNKSDTEQADSFRNILKEVLNTERGTKFYVAMRSSKTSNEPNEDENASNDLLLLDELIPNTKHQLFDDIDSKSYLKNVFLPLNLFKDTKNL